MPIMVFSYSAPFGVTTGVTGIYSFVSFPTPMSSTSPTSSNAEPDEPMHILEQQKPTYEQEAEERRLLIARLLEILQRMVTMPPGSNYFYQEPEDFSDMPELTPNY